MNKKLTARTLEAVLLGGLLSASTLASAAPDCKGLPSHAALRLALSSVVAGGGNAGLGNNMWGTVVNRDGEVCAIVFSGSDRDDQWPLSRVISAQKANTANGLSLDGFPLSSGNLNGVVQPGGSLFGLQHSNPVDTGAAYGGPQHAGGNASQYGRPGDPLVGHFVGGVNVFGGGLALYTAGGRVVGALGVSGDTSCTDHIIAWKTRDALGLDNVPGGVGDNGTNDNLILADPVTPNTFEHPVCGFGEEGIIPQLATTNPIGPN
ncbi:MAG: GlcG/HbpS family heme-binding protein [Gammaproteobacteria bacterium]